MASLKDRLAQNLQRNQQTHDSAPTRPPVGAPPPDEEVRRQVSYVPVSRVTPNPFQPRQEFDEDALTALAQSIAREGLLQPIVVRPNGAQGYQLVSGERRLRAFQRLGRAEIPALVLPMSDAESAAAALQENIKREELSDFEVAEGLRALRALKERAGEPTTISALADALSVSRPALYRYLAFDALPAPARDRLRAHPRLISGTTARELELWWRGVEAEGAPLEGYVEALSALLDGVEAGQLTQAGLVWAVKERLTPSAAPAEPPAAPADLAEPTAPTAPTAPAEPAADLRRGEIHFGRWETRDHQIKISLNRSALTLAQEQRLRVFLERLLKVGS